MLSASFLATIHGRRCIGLSLAGRALSLSLKLNRSHPSRDQRPRFKDTPSLVIFAKEPLRFFIIKPIIPGLVENLILLI